MSRVYSSGGDILLRDSSGKLIWSTATRPINLMGNAYKLTVGITAAFPHMPGGDAYALGRGTSIGGFDTTSCASFQTMYPGEWGPAQGGGYNLPDIYLGALPAGANMLDVVLNLTRTVEPSKYLSDDVFKFLPEGIDVPLRGDSALLEGMAAFRRKIDISIIGGGIYLRRYQSVINGGDPGIWTSGNSEYTGAGGIRQGWTYGGSPNAQFVGLLDAKGPSGNVNKNRSGSNACSVSQAFNYASTWSGTAIIIPGRYNI